MTGGGGREKRRMGRRTGNGRGKTKTAAGLRRRDVLTRYSKRERNVSVEEMSDGKTLTHNKNLAFPPLSIVNAQGQHYLALVCHLTPPPPRPSPLPTLNALLPFNLVSRLYVNTVDCVERTHVCH